MFPSSTLKSRSVASQSLVVESSCSPNAYPGGPNSGAGGRVAPGSAGSSPDGEVRSDLTTDELDAFQQTLEEGGLLDPTQCATVLAEAWCLRREQERLALELQSAREDSRQLRAQLDEVSRVNAALHSEREQLALTVPRGCELEERWTNCALRLKKAASGRG